MRTSTDNTAGWSRLASSVALRCALLVPLAGQVPVCFAGGGPFGIDHEWSYDNSGIWARPKQEALEYGMIAFEVGGALWEGADTRFGRTLWQSIDSSAASGLVALALKYAT